MRDKYVVIKSTSTMGVTAFTVPDYTALQQALRDGKLDEGDTVYEIVRVYRVDKQLPLVLNCLPPPEN